MLYKESNNLGDITINKAALNEIISSAVKPWVYTGKLKVLPEKVISLSGEGLLVCIHLSVAFGESTSSILEKVTETLVHEITNSLELELDDVVIYIDSMYTSKGTPVRRDIKYSYNDSKNL